jgi:hypothetical protein
LISAPLDEIQECAVVPFFNKIPKVKWVELQNSTHLGQFEEPERYVYTIREEFSVSNLTIFTLAKDITK